MESLKNVNPRLTNFNPKLTNFIPKFQSQIDKFQPEIDKFQSKINNFILKFTVTLEVIIQISPNEGLAKPGFCVAESGFLPILPFTQISVTSNGEW